MTILEIAKKNDLIIVPDESIRMLTKCVNTTCLESLLHNKNAYIDLENGCISFEINDIYYSLAIFTKCNDNYFLLTANDKIIQSTAYYTDIINFLKEIAN